MVMMVIRIKYLTFLIFFLITFSCSIKESITAYCDDYNFVNLSVEEIIKTINDHVKPTDEAVLIPLKTYYVDQAHTNAVDDADHGTEAEPWATISYAATRVSPGTKVIVKPGTYDERIKLKTAGTSTSYIIFQATGDVTTNGFEIYGDYNAVIGFEIHQAGELAIWEGGGIWISAHNIYIAKNKIYDFSPSAGIQGSWGGDELRQNIHIKCNYIYGCNKGIDIRANGWLVEDNEIERLIRPKSGGSDADYIRVMGQYVYVRNNYMHGTRGDEIGESHTDIFQTFYQSGGFAHYVLIERNICKDYHAQGFMIEVDGYSHTYFVIKNNVFINDGTGGSCINSHGLKGLHFISNTCYNYKHAGVAFRSEKKNKNAGTIGSIKNNIFANFRTSYYREQASSYDTGYNLIFNSNPPQDAVVTNLMGIDPLFIDVNNIIGNDGVPFTADDGLRLNNDSPAIGAGENGMNIGAY